ncbi:MAG: hypothetical protein AAGE01_09650 [Pseudomonadota bacterium]
MALRLRVPGQRGDKALEAVKLTGPVLGFGDDVNVLGSRGCAWHAKVMRNMHRLTPHLKLDFH